MSLPGKERPDARGPDPARPLRVTRRAWPAPRAVVGALLVTAAAAAVVAAISMAGQGPRHTYLVADRDLDAGTRIMAADLRPATAELPMEQANRAFTSMAELEGAVVLTPLAQGEIVQRGAVLSSPGASGAADAGAGLAGYEFSFAIDRDRAVNGDLQRGESVEVLATYGTGDAAQTIVVGRGAAVRTIDEGAGASLASTGTLVLTLSLASPEEVMALAHAVETAAVTVVRATRASAEPLPPTYQPEPARLTR